MAASLGLSACVDGPGPSHELVLGDAATFATDVQPVLSTTCANPACHGNEKRPLALYAPQRHRADPARVWLDEPLTDAELARNQVRVTAFALFAPSVEHVLLLCKPLAPAEGGCEHSGGIQLMDTDEPHYHALYDWTVAARDEGMP